MRDKYVIRLTAELDLNLGQVSLSKRARMVKLVLQLTGLSLDILFSTLQAELGNTIGGSCH